MRRWLALAILFAAPAMAQLPEIPFSTGNYQHNMSIGQCVYSGAFCVRAQQWGAYAVDVTSAAPWSVNTWMRSPVTSKGVNYQPASWTACEGEIHQSSQSVTASAGTPKWVVSTIGYLGYPHNCTLNRAAYKVQVYTLNQPSGLRYWGQVFVDALGSGDFIVDDEAYIAKGDGTWQSVHLNTMTLGPVLTMSQLPDWESQCCVGGYQYDLQLDLAIPDGKHLKLVRRGGPDPAPTTVPATPTPQGPTPSCPTAPPIIIFTNTPTPTVPGPTPTKTPTSRYVRTPRP